jgi:hypothetical protein
MGFDAMNVCLHILTIGRVVHREHVAAETSRQVDKSQRDFRG